MAEAKPKLVSVNVGAKTQTLGDYTLMSRRTDELVVGMVGPVGSGVTTAAKLLMTEFQNHYAYRTNYIRVSQIINEQQEQVDLKLETTDEAQRIADHQKGGTALRRKFGHTYLADKCVERIAVFRDQHGGYQDTVPLPLRDIHVIDSLKHPAEVELLREVYGNNFWLFGVFAPENVRRTRLSGFDSVALQKVMDTDEEEGLEYGQRTADTIQLGDFFIRNDGQNDQRLRSVIQRYLAIIFNTEVQTPTKDEEAMFNAASAAAGSACLSRQVGAVIYSKEGELIGNGANDVPKMGGGLYSITDGQDDHRCYKWAGKICHNDARKQKLYQSVHGVLRASNLISDKVTFLDIEAALRKTEAKDLIEYSRAVHAEMEAIISVARGEKAGIVGATMYSTTFPCHQCARHIVASGIDRVVYIEPYAKSLAIELHSDSVTQLEEGSGGRVVFQQYEGVAPKNMLRLFKHGLRRKNSSGKLLESVPTKAFPVFPSPLDGFAFREQMIVAKIKKIETGSQESETKSGDKKEPQAAQLDLPAQKPT